DSTVSGNTAFLNGGGIHLEPTIRPWTMTLINTTVSGNSAGVGGGIANGATLTLMNSTISGNSGGVGGGIANLGPNGTAALKNTILAGNPTGGDCSGTISSQGHNLIQNTAACTLIVGSGDITGVNPNLDLLADNG